MAKAIFWYAANAEKAWFNHASWNKKKKGRLRGRNRHCYRLRLLVILQENSLYDIEVKIKLRIAIAIMTIPRFRFYSSDTRLVKNLKITMLKLLWILQWILTNAKPWNRYFRELDIKNYRKSKKGERLWGILKTTLFRDKLPHLGHFWKTLFALE